MIFISRKQSGISLKAKHNELIENHRFHLENSYLCLETEYQQNEERDTQYCHYFGQPLPRRLQREGYSPGIRSLQGPLLELPGAGQG
jgi:hypothetical protein